MVVLGRYGSLSSYLGDCVLASISPAAVVGGMSLGRLVTLLELRHIESPTPPWNSMTLELSSELSDQPGETGIEEGEGGINDMVPPVLLQLHGDWVLEVTWIWLILMPCQLCVDQVEMEDHWALV